MRYKKTYYIFPSAFSDRLCDEIIENGMKNKPDIAFTGNRLPRNNKEVKNLKQKSFFIKKKCGTVPFV